MIALLYIALWFQTATLDHGRCSVCKQFHVKSTVTLGEMLCTSTAMACPSGTYDENGVYQPAKPCNTISCYRQGYCSRGHLVVVVESVPQ